MKALGYFGNLWHGLSPIPPKIPHKMASFYQLRGKWRAQVEKNGVRRSKLFARKGEAVAWAAQVEREIVTGDYSDRSETFGDLLDRYGREVSAGKKGARWEQVRIALLKRDRLAQVRLSKLDAPHVADWRDRRLQAVSGASVKREINLMSAACTVAVREWKWLAKNPFLLIRKPVDTKPRERVISTEELERLDAAATSPMQRQVIRALRFAMETGMRAGEICGLRDVRGNVAYLPDTKNGQPRAVPLSAEALRIWQEGPFGLTPATLDRHFRDIREICGLTDIHFHDSRRSAASRLAKILNPYELARMLGHKDLSMTLNTYYKDDPAAIAEKLG